MAGKRKVLLACKNYFDDSSVSKYNQHLATFLINKGFEVKVISFDDFVKELGFKDFKVVNRVKEVDEKSFKDWLMLINTRLKLLVDEKFSKQGFDLIHCSDWQVYPSCVLLKELMDKPLVLSYFKSHGLNNSKYSRVVKEFEDLGVKNSDLVLVSDEGLVPEVKNNNVRVIDPVLIDWQHRVLREYKKIMKKV